MFKTSLPATPFAFIWHFVKKYPVAFAVFFAAPLLLIAEAVVIPYAFKLIIDAFTLYDQDRANILETITPALWLAGGSWLTLSIGARLQEWWQVSVFPRFEADIRLSTIRYLLDHSYNYFANQLSGNLANKISDLPRSIDMLSMHLRWNAVGTFAVVTALLVMLWTVSPLFSVIALVWVLIDLIISFSFVIYVGKAGEQNAEDKSQLTGRIVDTITNVISSKLFAKRLHEMEYIKASQDIEKKSNSLLRWRVMVYRFFIDLPSTLMWIVVGYFMITYWQQGKMTTGDLVFVFNGIWAVMFRLWFLGEALAEMFKEYSTIKQALSIIIQPHEVVDAKDAKTLEVTKGKIEFKEVSFHYNKGENVFENKNITIEPGSKVGLVGFSGSGKTTFVNLILRFFDVESGAILIDGQEISNVTQDSLRTHIAMIPQDTSLFHRSLYENISYGNMASSKEDIIRAAQQSHCEEFIEKLPQGYHTMVGERGIKLSGGQRQRIAIARAMLKNAPILILDEATSALDSVTEKYIQESLNELMKQRTTIVVAHRLSTLSEMDRILVFDKGHIIEDGSHEQLLKIKEGHYRHMWEMQAGGFLPE